MALDPNFKPVLRFMVVSDIHIKDDPACAERARFAKAIRSAYKIAASSESYKQLDALYIVGDFANSGTEIQMRAVKQIIDDNLRPETLYRLTMASHEYHGDGEENARRRFADIFGLPLDSHEVIHGFHFIAITTTRGCEFDEPQQTFARENLKAAAADDPKKPIFFFQHPHLTGTVFGSVYWGDHALIPILMNYPQVIDFSGHSHAPINDPRSIYQDHFTALGTGTLSYFELDEFDKICGTFPSHKEDAAQMLLVEADADNRVRIYPYDVLTDQFFPQVWKIDVPSDPSTFLYAQTRRCKIMTAPAFAADSAITVDAGRDSAAITFPQAIPAEGEDYVNSYLLVVRNAATRVIAKQVSIWSDYYFIDMPSVLTQTVDALDPATDYTVAIYPQGFYMNRGQTPLRGSFRTK